MPRPLKSDDRRQRRNERPGIALTVGSIAPSHPAPTGLLKDTRDSWVEFWQSPYAAVVNADRDLRALRRLFTLYDARERAWRSYCKKPVVIGSTGQEVVNPLWKDARALEVEIRNLEDRFGLSPKAAAALGITVGVLQKTLDDLEREANDEASA